MKKTHLIILITILLTGTAYLGCASDTKESSTTESYTEVKSSPASPQTTAVADAQVLPDFTLNDIKGKAYSIHELSDNKPTLFIYFSSTCHLCQDELAALSKRITEFKDYNLILTTVEPLEEVMGFINSLGIKDNSNVHFLLDSEMRVATYLQIRSVPSIFVYGSNKELVDKYVGITEIDLLKEKLAQGV